MKKLSLITLALLTLLFSQCKKEKIDSSGTDANNIKVRCDVTMGNGAKTDFTDPLFSEGSIQWSTGYEYIYLVVNGTDSQIIELSANNDTGESVTTLSFSGTMSADIISEGNTYQIWYFGNSHKLGEDSYVTKPEPNNVITQIDGSIATQSGSLSDLGYHHIAMADATAQLENDEVVLSIVDGGGLQSQIAIAYMDLSEVSSLKGDAIVGTGFSLKQQTDGTYSLEIDETDKVINITGTNETPEKSFVVLFPNNVNNIIIDNNNFYRHTFKNGLVANNFYYKKLSNIENATLEWEYYPFYNGHEFVDLGLPTGTLWAKYNIGVDPNELLNYGYYYGNYYQWGAVGNEQVNYAGYDNNYWHKDDVHITGTQYDAATHSWGANWCMPTKTQMEELVANCNCEYVTSYNGINRLNGFKLTSNKDGYTDRYIFLPAANAKFSDNLQTSNGYYWSSTSSSTGSYAYYLILEVVEGEGSIYVTNETNEYMSDKVGCTVRPVFAPSNSNE